MDDDAEAIMDCSTKAGKEITINIKVIDQDKASKLLATMNKHNIDMFGIQVTSWGFWNTQKANQLKIEAMNKESDRHAQEMRRLVTKSDREFLCESIEDD